VRELPTGTVTFLFTDIEGSTRLLKQLGAGYADVLEEHHRLLRRVFAEFGGREVDTQGDALFVAFARAKDAVAGAVEAQQALAAHAWPDRVEVRVRMGLHTGEPIVGSDRYVGLGVHTAARVCSAGHGGQILLSSITRALVEDDLPEHTTLSDLGDHRLKDLERPERVFQLVVEGLPQQFPALKTTQPSAASALVGRTGELGELVACLEDALSGRGRLVLVAGEPGIGKSRLADELSTRARERGASVLVGRCWEAGGAPPFWPWVQALRAHVREAEADVLRAQLGRGAPDVAQILPELREILPDLPMPPSLDSEGARFRLFDSIASFLRKTAISRPRASTSLRRPVASTPWVTDRSHTSDQFTVEITAPSTAASTTSPPRSPWSIASRAEASTTGRLSLTRCVRASTPRDAARGARRPATPHLESRRSGAEVARESPLGVRGRADPPRPSP